MMFEPSAETVIRLPLCNRESSLEDFYASMFAIRTFENSIMDLFAEGLLVGTTHTCLGQEATAVGVVSALNCRSDIVFSNHRGHGHFLAYCGEVERLYLELMGKPEGMCGGRGGSQHLHYRNFYSNGIQGGIVPVATGMALAEKKKDTGTVAAVFLGDGTLGEGVVYESFNMASLWRVPILFVIENNGYAQSTPSRLQIAGSMGGRAEAFGISVVEQATTDVRTVLSLASELVDAVRAECRPYCLLLHTYRLGPHSKGDDHREPAEIASAWQRDPLTVIRPSLNLASLKRIEMNLAATIRQAKERALNAAVYD